MKTESASARHPLRAMRVIKQAAIQLPGFSAVRGFEKCRRLDAAIECVRVVRVHHDLPDLFERYVRAFGELDVVGFGFAPALAKVAGGAEKRAPEGTVDRGPELPAIVAAVIRQSIDTAPREKWAGFLPVRAAAVGAKDEGAFHRTDEQQIVAGLNIDLRWLWHTRPRKQS